MRTKQVARRLGNSRKIRPMAAGTVLAYTRARIRVLVDTTIYRIPPIGQDRELLAEGLGFAIQDRVIRELQTGVRS